MLKVTVVTADVIDSKRYKHLLGEITPRLHQIKTVSVISPFSFSRGDEIQGVLSGWLTQPQVIRHLRYACRPLELRIGMGIGFIHEQEIKENSWDMDGYPFHLAREALEELQKQKKACTFLKSGCPDLDIWINTIWLLIDTIEQKWTPAQWEGIQAYEKAGTYQKAAQLLGISFQNVQKRCRAAHWQQIKHAEDTLKGTEYLYKAFGEKFTSL